jgi:hypothetical protein
MNLKTIIGLLFLTFVAVSARSQRYPDKDKYTIGIKTGTAFSSLIGKELQNPRVKFGFQGGVYYRQKLRSSLHLLTELNASFRGSNFDNGKTGYNRISLLNLDLPITLMIDVSKKKNEHLIFFGPQLTYLAKSDLYVNPDNVSKYQNLDLKPWDVMAVAGYHYNGYYMGWQIAAKYGLTDINDGIKFIDVSPVTGTGKLIRNVSLELSMFF